MPNYEIALPKGANKLEDLWESFTRSSKDGDIPIIVLFSGDTFDLGDVLEKKWHKECDALMLGPFTALISGGELQITGRTNAAATDRFGWVWAERSPILIKDDVTIDVHLKLPGHSAANDFHWLFFLTAAYSGSPTVNPGSLAKYLQVYIWTDNADYKIAIAKSVDTVYTGLLALTAITNAEGTFRMKFQEEQDGHTHFYFHDGAGDIIESADEVAGSPFDLDLGFDIGYPAYMLQTDEATNRMVSSEFVKVTYPDLTGLFGPRSTADFHLGDVELWDTMNDAVEANWIRVYDEDHQFTGDCVIQNGLIRIFIDNGVDTGFDYYYWTGSAWVQAMDIFYPRHREGGYTGTPVTDLKWPYFKRLESLSQEKVELQVKFCDSGADNDNIYSLHRVTLERGKPYFMIEILDLRPRGAGFYYNCDRTTSPHIGVPALSVADIESYGIGDRTLATSGENTDMTDNGAIAFNEEE